MSSFSKKLDMLKDDLVTQGDRVYQQLLRAVDCYFDRDTVRAEEVIRGDEIIDRVDVEIERASIPLLAMGELDEHAIRYILTIVKVNNELERCADCAVDIAEVVRQHHDEMSEPVPVRFRVMANSVIGMLRDANRALSELNGNLAQQVLEFDDTVSEFKRQIEMDAEQQVAAGGMTVGFAFRIRTVTARLERVADHCTNISEQIIYLESGKIVRHLPEGWTKPELPKL